MPSKISGVAVLLKVGTNVIGGQTGLTINRSAETIETTDKSSLGSKEYISSWKDWSVDCDAFVILGEAGQELLEDAYEDGTSVQVIVRIGGPAEATGFTYTGTAFITDMSQDAPKDDAVTYSVSLQGSGKLVRTVGIQV